MKQRGKKKQNSSRAQKKATTNLHEKTSVSSDLFSQEKLFRQTNCFMIYELKTP